MGCADQRLEGVVALRSIVRMPAGATVAIDYAAILAMQVIAAGDPVLRGRLRSDKLALRDKVVEKSLALRQESPA